MRGFSNESGLIEQEEEWALLSGSWVLEGSVVVLAVVPELEPVEVVGTSLDVIIHAAMLEEKVLVTPEGADLVGSGHQPAHEDLLTTELGRLIETDQLVLDGVDGNDGHLVLEIIFVLVAPAVNIVSLNVDLVGPVRIRLLATLFVEEGEVHD